MTMKEDPPFAPGRTQLRLDGFVLDLAQRELQRDGERVAIEPQVFELLAYLAQNPNRLVSKDELLKAIWGNRIVSDSAIANRINSARRVIGDSGEAQRLIRTVPRQGYRFIGAVETSAVGRGERPAARTTAPVRRPVAGGVLSIAASSVLAAGLTALVLWLPGFLSAPIGERFSGHLPTDGLAQALRPRVAMLPLTVIDGGGDPEISRLSVSLTTELVTELARGPGRLVSPHGALPVATLSDASLPQLARALGVHYLVEGSLEQIGGQIRVTLRLVEAETGLYIWSDRFEHPVNAPSELRDGIVGRMVNGVRTALTIDQAQRPRAENDPARWIWRGLAELRTSTSRVTDEAAVTSLGRALALAPRSFTAKVGLANALANASFGATNTERERMLERATGLADDGVNIAPKSGWAHFTRAQVLRARGACGSAIGEFEIAIELDRNIANASALLGMCKLMAGAIDDVIALEQRAIRIDPFNPSAPGYYQRIGMAELLQSHIGPAISALERARTLYSSRRDAPAGQNASWLTAAYALNGEIGRAANAMAEARQWPGYPTTIAQQRQHWSMFYDTGIQAKADATYFKGLALAGMPKE